LARFTGEIEVLADAVSTLARRPGRTARDHSPLDWARAQVGLARRCRRWARAPPANGPTEQAVTCYDRANVVLKDVSGLALRASAQSNRALCLARSAELTGDLAVLDAAEAAFKIELSNEQASRDPVGWALAQVNLARLYEARMEITGKDRGERAAGRHGAERGLRRLRRAGPALVQRHRHRRAGTPARGTASTRRSAGLNFTLLNPSRPWQHAPGRFGGIHARGWFRERRWEDSGYPAC